MPEQTQSTVKHYSLALFALYSIGLGCLGYLAWENELKVSAGLIAVIVASSLSGYRMGGISFVSVLIGTILATLFAAPLGNLIEPLLLEHASLTGMSARMTALGIGGGGILLVSLAIAGFLSKAMCKDRPLLETCNRWFGVGLGTCQAVCIVALILGGFITMEPMLREKSQDPAIRGSAIRSAIVGGVLAILDESDDDPAGRWLIRYNPFEKIPQLKSLAQRLQAVNDPGKLQQLVQQLSGSGSGAAESPAVKHAVSELRDAPRLRPFLVEGKPLDQQTMGSLMTNPAVLTLMDDPAIQEKLRDVR